MAEDAAAPGAAGLTAAAPARAILLKVLNVLALVVMLSCVKAVTNVPVGEVIFFRCFFSIIPIWLWLRWRGERILPSFRTRRPWAHVTRTALGMATLTLAFVSVRALPLPESITLQYAQPLFVVAFSALFLRERVRLFRWGAVAFGFLGVLVITWPSLTLLTSGAASMTQAEIVGAAAALTAAATLAITLLLVRQLVHTERSTTIVLWFWMLSSAATAMTSVFGWVPLSAGQVAILVLCGFLGGTAHLLMAESLRYAPASTTAAFEYTSIVFASILGFIMFGDIPGANTLAGGAMVIAAGLLIIWREKGRAAKAH